MLLRKSEGDRTVVAIPQPSHAWLSGQLARAWGNARFAAPAPFEEVCFGAALHDIGWLAWEASPAFDPGTGLPQEFMDVPTPVHLSLWREGVGRALAFGRYPALLVSLHANTIYSRYFDMDKASPDDAAAVRVFLDEQHAWQAETAASLGTAADPQVAGHVSPEALERNRLLVAALDRLSLEICWGVTKDVRIPNVPSSGPDRTELALRPTGDGGRDLTLDPWPFGTDRVDVRADGRVLRGPYPDEDAMRRALDAAERVTVAATLRPA